MAQYNLGLAYYRGEGVERSYPEAIDWFRKAAGQGVRDAQYALGQMYLLGISVPKDDGRALGWYQLAAAQGHPQAKQQVDTLTKAGVRPVTPGTAIAAPAAAGAPLALVGDGQVQPAPQTAPAAQAPPQPVGQPIKLTPDAPSTVEVTQLPAAGTAAADSAQPSTQAPAQAAAQAAAQSATGAPKIVYEDTPQPKGNPSAAQPQTQTQAQSQAQAPSQTAGTGAVPGAVQQAAVQPTAGGRFRVWLGSGADEGEARTMWGQLRARHGGSLVTMEHWLVPAQGGFYRLLAGPLASLDDARRLCNGLRAGDPLTFCKPYQ
jgi:hypothetical protein